jgi:hypothetical protein
LHAFGSIGGIWPESLTHPVMLLENLSIRLLSLGFILLSVHKSVFLTSKLLFIDVDQLVSLLDT